ncbi:MAG: hypothetical protein J6Y02_12555 [Pseudobutyrivibrio sp.]|nr:hypothetical protein [Pseudobutyrivibrio sp.]
MATLIVTRTDFDIDIPKTCNECMFITCDNSDYGDYKARCLLLKSDSDTFEDDEYSELDVDHYCIEGTKCPRCPIISMKRDEA